MHSNATYMLNLPYWLIVPRVICMCRMTRSEPPWSEYDISTDIKDQHLPLFLSNKTHSPDAKGRAVSENRSAYFGPAPWSESSGQRSYAIMDRLAQPFFQEMYFGISGFLETSNWLILARRSIFWIDVMRWEINQEATKLQNKTPTNQTKIEESGVMLNVCSCRL